MNKCNNSLRKSIVLYKLAKNSELPTKYKSVIAKATKENMPHILFHQFDSEARNLTDNKQTRN